MQDKTKNNKKSIYMALAAAVLLIAALRAFVVDWTVINGESMTPALLNGELALSEKISKLTDSIQRGDIVVLSLSDGLQGVKRIIGLGGDKLSIQSGKLILNGEISSEPYLTNSMDTDMKQITVPEDMVFVMGDNRNYSLDSRNRDIGCIPEKSIKGRIFYVVYPFKAIRTA